MPDLFTAAQREEQREPERLSASAGTTGQEVPAEMLDFKRWYVPPTGAAPGGQATEVPPEMLDFQKFYVPPDSSGNAEEEAKAERISSLARKEASAQTEVDRTLPEEIGASVVRGALGIAKLPFQVAKIVGSDVLGSETVKKATS